MVDARDIDEVVETELVAAKFAELGQGFDFYGNRFLASKFPFGKNRLPRGDSRGASKLPRGSYGFGKRLFLVPH